MVPALPGGCSGEVRIGQNYDGGVLEVLKLLKMPFTVKVAKLIGFLVQA